MSVTVCNKRYLWMVSSSTVLVLWHVIYMYCVGWFNTSNVKRAAHSQYSSWFSVTSWLLNVCVCSLIAIIAIGVFRNSRTWHDRNVVISKITTIVSSQTSIYCRTSAKHSTSCHCHAHRLECHGIQLSLGSRISGVLYNSKLCASCPWHCMLVHAQFL